VTSDTTLQAVTSSNSTDESVDAAYASVVTESTAEPHNSAVKVDEETSGKSQERYTKVPTGLVSTKSDITLAKRSIISELCLAPL